jgi:hypothetical protein
MVTDTLSRPFPLGQRLASPFIHVKVKKYRLIWGNLGDISIHSLRLRLSVGFFLGCGFTIRQHFHLRMGWHGQRRPLIPDHRQQPRTIIGE